VPESVVPPAGERVVYLGHSTRARGVDLVAETARRLAGSGVSVEVMGHGDSYAKDVLRRADKEGVLRWHGFIPNNKATALLDGALCGLSLLRDLPNYRQSMPTKILEYMAHGIPVVTTPLPAAVTLTQVHKCGLVVPFNDPDAAAAAVLQLRDDPQLRRSMGDLGHRAARMGYHWPDAAREFVLRLDRWAKAARSDQCLTLGTA
jgi:glycosyltransferase involved in cell wall biosynthesis